MNEFYPLTDKENIINLQGNKSEEYGRVAPSVMFKLDDLEKKSICEILGISSLQDLEKESHYKGRKKWLDEGLDCEVLRLGAKKWQKGKLRIKVVAEFCPDEPEEIESNSPLDDIRKTINE